MTPLIKQEFHNDSQDFLKVKDLNEVTNEASDIEFESPLNLNKIDTFKKFKIMDEDLLSENETNLGHINIMVRFMAIHNIILKF